MLKHSYNLHDVACLSCYSRLPVSILITFTVSLLGCLLFIIAEPSYMNCRTFSKRFSKTFGQNSTAFIFNNMREKYLIPRIKLGGRRGF